MEVRSIKEGGGKQTSIGSPQRGDMSDSYGTNYRRYVDDNSSEIRNERASYEKGVFRSGGNYGPTGSGDISSPYGRAS